MGFFDGGLFDFDGDGKTSLDEEFTAFMIFNEMTREDEAERRQAGMFDVGDDDDEEDFF